MWLTSKDGLFPTQLPRSDNPIVFCLYHIILPPYIAPCVTVPLNLLHKLIPIQIIQSIASVILIILLRSMLKFVTSISI